MSLPPPPPVKNIQRSIHGGCTRRSLLSWEGKEGLLCRWPVDTHKGLRFSALSLISLSRFLWTSLWLALFLFSPISLRIWTESEGGGVSQPASAPPQQWDKEAMRDLGCECKASTHWPNDLGEAHSERFNTPQQGTITNMNTTEPTEGGRIWKTNDLSQINLGPLALTCCHSGKESERL